MTIDHHHLRVLIANEREDRIALVTTLVSGLGHTVIAGSTHVVEVGALTSSRAPRRRARRSRHQLTHALELIERIVREAECPVIAVLEGHDAAFVDEAAKRGVFAYIVDGSPERTAERARHHAPPLRRVSQPAGRLRPPRADRARQGDPHGALPGRRAPGVRDAARPRAPQRAEARPRRPGSARRASAAAREPGWRGAIGAEQRRAAAAPDEGTQESGP